MKLFSLYRVELRRMCHSKMFWQTAFLSLCAPLLGYSVYEPARPDIMAGHYIANPVLAGTAAGAVLWMAFALFEADRPRRSGTDELAESVVSPVYLSAAGMGAKLTLSAAVTIACALLYLPYTAKRMDYLFGAGFYFENFLVFMLLTWWVSILLADALYYITNRVELSAACYAGLAYPGLGFGFGERDYFVRWLNPMVISYSDGFPSLWPLRVGLYSRGIWLCLGLGGFLCSLLCIRRYRKGLAASVVAAFRKPGPAKAYLPVSAAAIAAAGIFLWIYQPFVDHGPESVVYRAMEKDAYVKTATYAHFSINTEPVSGKVFGRAQYQLPVPYSGESVLWLNSGYRITGMTYGGWPVPFRTVEEDVNGDRPTYFTVQGDYGKNLVIEYEGIPAAAKSTARYRVTDTVDYDYIALGGQALLPWMENYWCRESTLEITIPGGLTPFVNYGLMEECVDNGNGTKTWSCADVNYIMDFTAGHYVVERLSMEGMEIDFAYGESYQEAVEEYHVKQAVLDVFDYGNRHYGEMEFLDDGRLLLLQRSAMFSGGTARPGMSQWFEVVLSPDTLGNPEKGASATEVFIHEMLHQWWGGYGLICEGEDVWSNEGLTVYSTYRFVKEKYGALYAQKYYVDEWQRAVDWQDRNFYNRHPEYLELLSEGSRARIISANNGTNWYMRMPLMILKAEELVGGEEEMDEILKRMYADREEFNTHYFTYQDFLDYCGLTEEELRLE